MFNFGVLTNENNAENNLKWPYIPHHSYKVLTIRDSGSGKPNALLILIKEQDSDILVTIDKVYLYAKGLNEQKYQLLIKNMKMQK